MKYRVTLTGVAHRTVEVEADSAEEARDAAEDGEGLPVEEWEVFDGGTAISAEEAE